MAEVTKGGGFRERIHFDAPLWHEIEALAEHMRLTPRDVVVLLCAMGAAQMKGLTLMASAGHRQLLAEVVKEQLEQDFERLSGISASSPVVGTAPAQSANQ